MCFFLNHATQHKKENSFKGIFNIKFVRMEKIMGNNDMNLVVKILLIVAVVFCGLSLIVPWIGVGPWGYYTWGFNVLDEWNFFYIDSFTSGVTEAITFGISMIIAFFITIAALIVGAVGIKNVGIKKSNSLLTAGILSIVAIIFCVVAMSQFGNNTFGIIGYSYGFFMMIFSAVMFFVAYGIAAVSVSSTPTPVTPPAAVPQQMFYQQPPTTPKMGQPPMQPMPQQTPPPVTPPPPPPQPAQQQQSAVQKFCPECGTKIQGNPKFCPECGKKIA